MRFNEQSYPVLRMLREEKLGVIGFYESDKQIIDPSNYYIIEHAKNNFYLFTQFYKKRIQALSQTFTNAIHQSIASLIRDEVWNNIGQRSGTLLNMMFMGERLSVMYYIDGDSGCEKHNATIYYFVKDVMIGYYWQDLIVTNKRFAFIANGMVDIFSQWLKNSGQQPYVNFNREQVLEELVNQLYTILIANLNFIKYAEIETKYLAEGQREKFVGCKYLNESEHNIQILNSTWFTNLIKSDAFNVRGHFRLQACGHEMKERKLIWINEFQKTGYTAPARKLVESNLQVVR